jgi:hypothetical protein
MVGKIGGGCYGRIDDGGLVGKGGGVEGENERGKEVGIERWWVKRKGKVGGFGMEKKLSVGRRWLE